MVSIPRSPKEGSTPTDIVTGFLLANASSVNDYAIARSYLAPEISEGWNPNAGAVVYDDATGLNLSERGTTVALSEPQNGTMTSAGSYQPSPAGSRLRTDFTLRKVDGQWRIVGVRDGLLLSVRDVESVYQGVDRYYFNERRTALVPDRVLVPGDRAGVQTTLVRGLLQGASAWLAPAVSTAFPSGTTLAIDSVPVVDGVATVDLSREVLGADDAARRLLSAQLVWSLTSLGTVNGVRITVSGQPLSVPGVADVMTRSDFAGVDPNVLALGTPGYVVIGKKLCVLSSSPRRRCPECSATVRSPPRGSRSTSMPRWLRSRCRRAARAAPCSPAPCAAGRRRCHARRRRPWEACRTPWVATSGSSTRRRDA